MKKIPHIFFNSALDLASDWHHWPRAELVDIIFSVEDDCHDKSDVDVVLLWTPPTSGRKCMTNLNAILSLGASVDQLMLSSLPVNVPLARLFDTSPTCHMVKYARACVFRYHPRLHVFERNSYECRCEWSEPRLTWESVICVLGLYQIGGTIVLALRQEGF